MAKIQVIAVRKDGLTMNKIYDAKSVDQTLIDLGQAGLELEGNPADIGVRSVTVSLIGE